MIAIINMKKLANMFIISSQLPLWLEINYPHSCIAAFGIFTADILSHNYDMLNIILGLLMPNAVTSLMWTCEI